jgi:hypothetical protein
MNFPKSPGFGPTLPAGALYPKKVQIVRNREGHLMGFNQRGRTYVIGFPGGMYVKHVCEVMGANSRMSLSNHLPTTSLLSGAAKPNERGVDVAAHFTLEKRRLGPLGSAGAALADAARKHVGCRDSGALAAWSVTEMDFTTFIMLPFRKNLGIIIPMDLMLDDRRRLIFESHVIDPCRDPCMFRLTPIR